MKVIRSGDENNRINGALAVLLKRQDVNEGTYRCCYMAVIT